MEGQGWHARGRRRGASGCAAAETRLDEVTAGAEPEPSCFARSPSGSKPCEAWGSGRLPSAPPYTPSRTVPHLMLVLSSLLPGHSFHHLGNFYFGEKLIHMV